MAKRMIIMLILAAIVLGGVFGFQAFKAKMIAQAIAGLGNQPQTVSAASAELQDWQPQLEAVGSFRAVNGADLAMEVSGIVDQISFNSGDDVAAGQALLQLRADDDIGRLHSLEAAADLANIVYERDQKQLKIQAVSQAVLDTDAANLKSARAQVAEQKAVIAKKTVRAPFAGRLGIRNADLGQYLAAGTVIVTLQALDPIYLDFFLPQQELDRIKEGQAIAAGVDTYPDQAFTGEISAINPKVDPATRNVQVRATFKNPDRRLLPGMYARVNITVGAPERHVTLPQTAITYNPYGNTVYAVDSKTDKPDAPPQLTARQVFVTLGATRGDQVAVLKGINPGDTIVTNGQTKLRNGSPINIDNTIAPAADSHPKPVDD
jgi:membrane fusion protein, multidrug efflux system